MSWLKPDSPKFELDTTSQRQIVLLIAQMSGSVRGRKGSIRCTDRRQLGRFYHPHIGQPTEIHHHM